MRLLIATLMMSISFVAHSLEFEAGSSGGMGGIPFKNSPPSDFSQINSIKICSERVIISIETTYSDMSGNIYSYGKSGGIGGACDTFYFWAGEHITSVTGRYGKYVDSLTISTNYGRLFAKGGTGGQKTYTYTANNQFAIAGFKGASGSYIDSIGVVYVQMY